MTHRQELWNSCCDQARVPRAATVPSEDTSSARRSVTQLWLPDGQPWQAAPSQMHTRSPRSPNTPPRSRGRPEDRHRLVHPAGPGRFVPHLALLLPWLWLACVVLTPPCPTTAVVDVDIRLSFGNSSQQETEALKIQETVFHSVLLKLIF